MLHVLCYNSYHDTCIKINTKHSWRFLYSSVSLFIYLRSSLASTRTYTPMLMHTPWILHTKGSSARGMSPNQRHDRLNLALANYTSDTLFLVAHRPSSFPSLDLFLSYSPLFFARSDPHNRIGLAGMFTNWAHNSRAYRCARHISEYAVFLCVHLKTNVEDTTIIVVVKLLPKVGEQRDVI